MCQEVHVFKSFRNVGKDKCVDRPTAGPACVVPKPCRGRFPAPVVAGCVAYSEKGRGCPSSGCQDALNKNVGFDTFAEAWAACGELANAGCAHIHRTALQPFKFHLRKDSDPIMMTAQNDTLPLFAGSMPYAACKVGNTPTAGPACVVPKAAFTEKARGCATENNCFDGKTLNNNTGFDTFAEAWAACGDAANAGCAHIIHTPNNFDNTPRGKMLARQYFLRKDTDPIRDNLPNGGMPFVACKGIRAPLGCASASIALGHPRASGAARPRSSPRAKALLFNSREAAAMIHLDDPVPHTVDTH